MTHIEKDKAELVADEHEAIEGYDKAISEETNPENKKTLEHIRDEEKEHVEELNDMGKDKLSSDEAWEDFKSNYDKEDFEEAHKEEEYSGGDAGDTVSERRRKAKKSTDAQNDSTLDGKLDTLSSQVLELQTDVERVVDEIPKMEEAVQTEENLEGEGDDLFGDDDIFASDEEGGEEAVGEEGAVDEEGNPIDEEGGDAFADEEGGEELGDEEDFAEEGEEEDASDDLGGESDESFEEGGEEATPIEDVIGDDGSADEEGASEDEDKEEDEKLMESMVKHIVKLNKRMNALEKENKELSAKVRSIEKMQKSITVQKQSLGRGNAIRHHPIYKSVGVVSKPPVSIGFNSQYSEEDGTTVAQKSFKDPKALVENYKQKGIL